MATLSIRKTIPLLVISPLVLAIGLIGSLAIYYGRKSVDQLSENLMRGTTNHIRDQVVSLMQEAPLINRINANTIYDGQLDLQQQTGWWRYFNSQLTATTVVTDIYFGNQQGDFIGSQKREAEMRVLQSDQARKGWFNQYVVAGEGGLSPTPIASYQYDPRIRDWYKAAQSANQPVWSNVYVGTTSQELLITAAHPVYDRRNQLLGVLGTDMFLREIDQFLGTLEVGKTGEVFIIEQDGLLVASSIGQTIITPDQPLNDDQDDGQSQRISAFNSSEPLISDPVEHLSQAYGDLSLIDNNLRMTRQVKGQRAFISVRPFQDQLGLEWLIVVVVPTRDFTGPLRTQMLIMAVFALVVLAGAVGLGLLVGRWIVAPVLRLHTAAIDVKSQTFDPDDIAHLVKRRDEIGQFAGVFAEMAEIIGEREESMEEQLKYLRLQAPMPDVHRSLDLSELHALQQKAKVIRNMQSH